MAKAKKKGKKRSAAQIAATKKMLAANKAKRSGKKAAKKSASKPRKVKAKKSSPKKTKTAKRAGAAPRKSKSKGPKTMKKSKRKSSGSRKQMLASVIDAAKGGAVGGVSALGLDVVMGNLPLPDKLKTGPGGVATRAALSVVGGMAIGHLTKNQKAGRDATVGMLSVTVRDSARSVIQTKFPSVQLGALADLSEAFEGDVSQIHGLAEAIDMQLNGNTFENGSPFGSDDDAVAGLNGQMATIW